MFRAGRRDIRPGPEIMVGLWGQKPNAPARGYWGVMGGVGDRGEPFYFPHTIRKLRKSSWVNKYMTARERV
jgi:hypothetical protein